MGSCKDVNNILSKMPCDNMDEQQTQSVSRMKEIASTIVTNRAKLAATRHCEIREPVELVCNQTMFFVCFFLSTNLIFVSNEWQMIQVNGADEETVDSDVGIKDIDPEEIQRRLFGNVSVRGRN